MEGNRELFELRKLTAEITKLEQMIQDYMVKRNENEMVKQEFVFLTEDSVIYKLIGPALIKQNLTEAKTNVDKRLEFINEKLNSLGKLKQDLLVKAEEKKKKIAQQAQLAQQAQQAQMQQMQAMMQQQKQ